MRSGDCVGLQVRRLDEDFRILEFRKVFRNRIFQPEEAFFIEHHDGDAGDGLAHGADAEDRIGPHGLAGFAVLHPLRFEPSDVAVTNDQGDGAGKALVIDALLHRSADAIKTLGGKADGFGLGGGCRRGADGDGQNQRVEQDREASSRCSQSSDHAFDHGFRFSL